MKTILSLSALLITLTLTAQTNTATWYLNDTSGNGIQSNNTTASGEGSTAMGYNTTASGSWSTAMGFYTTASGNYSTAMGYQTEASGAASTAMGGETQASGLLSTAMGLSTIASDTSSLVIGEYNLLGSTVTNSATDFSTDNTAFVIGNGVDAGNRSDALTVLFDGTTNVAGSVTATAFIGDGSQLTNLSVSSPFSLNDESGTGIQSETNTASGDYSTAMGYYTTASGIGSVSMGYSTNSSGGFSTAMGDITRASGYASTAMGYNTTASGSRSTAMGYYTTASDYGSLVVGQYNSSGSYVTNSASQFSTANTAFVIGNGLYDDRSDALTVLFDGTTTIAGDLSINSDARLKANIISLGSTLAKLLQIDGKTYTMKKDENKKQKIGVLAQDIEKVFPELVSESNGVKSVNYQGLVPVLINALKEQDSKMKEQEARIERLEKLLLNS